MNDASFNYAPCIRCGNAENDPSYVTRMPCERCGLVWCYECADTGVYGSKPDFEHFVFGNFRSRSKANHLNADSCPDCQEMSWMRKNGG